MWKALNCYLSGGHDYGISCERGAMFLRCVRCGKRSSGWEVSSQSRVLAAATAKVESQTVTRTTPTRATPTRVLPFSRESAAG